MRRVNEDERLFFLPPLKVHKLRLLHQMRVDWRMAFPAMPGLCYHSGGKSVSVAILDTGIDPYHPALYRRILLAKDFTYSHSGIADLVGHGTFCAGLIAAEGHIKGLAPKCNLLIAKVLDEKTRGQANEIEAGIDWAVENGAEIIAMGCGSEIDFESVHNSIQRALEKGVLIWCSRHEKYPAAYEGVLSVDRVPDKGALGATNNTLAIDGCKLRSVWPLGQSAQLSGVSLPVGLACGLSALLLAKYKQFGGEPALNGPAEILARLQEIV